MLPKNPSGQTSMGLAVCRGRLCGRFSRVMFPHLGPKQKDWTSGRGSCAGEAFPLCWRPATSPPSFPTRPGPRSVLLIAEKRWHVPGDSHSLTRHKPPTCKVLPLAYAPVAIRGVVKPLTKTLTFLFLLLSFSETCFSLSESHPMFPNAVSWTPLRPVPLACEPCPCLACGRSLLMVTSRLRPQLLPPGLFLPSGL